MDEIKVEFMQADFGKLELKEGDYLVLTFRNTYPTSAIEHMKMELAKVLPEGVKVLVFNANVDIGVLRYPKES